MQTAAIVLLLALLVLKLLDDRRARRARDRVELHFVNKALTSLNRSAIALEEIVRPPHPNCRSIQLPVFGIDVAGGERDQDQPIESGGAIAAMAKSHGLTSGQQSDQEAVERYQYDGQVGESEAAHDATRATLLEEATIEPPADEAPLCLDEDCVLERHYGQHIFRVDDQAQDGPVGEHADDTIIVAVKLGDDPDQAKDTFAQLVDEAAERHVGAQGHVPAELYQDQTSAIIEPPLEQDDEDDDQADEEERITSVTTEDVRTGDWKPVTHRPIHITCPHCEWDAETRTPVRVVDEHLKDCPGLEGSRIAADVAELADTHPETNAILSTTTPEVAAEAALKLANRAAPLPVPPASTFDVLPAKTAQRAADPLATAREALQPGVATTPPRKERVGTPAIPVGWCDVSEASEITGLSLPTLRKWATNGKLESRKHPALGRMGWKHIVSRSDCERIRDERA